GPPAGQEAAAPFNLANVIVVHTADSARTAYQKLTLLLLAQGYQLVETDSAQGRISTDYHRSAYRRIKVSLQFVISAHARGALVEERAIGQVSVAASRFAVECRGTPNMPIACACPPHTARAESRSRSEALGYPLAEEVITWAIRGQGTWPLLKVWYRSQTGGLLGAALRCAWMTTLRWQRLGDDGCALGLLGEAPLAAADPPPGARRGQPGIRALANQLALKLTNEANRLNTSRPWAKVVLERAPQAVELVDVNRVAGAQLTQQLVQLRAAGVGAGYLFLIDGLAAGLGQGIELQLQILVAGRDAGVADVHGAKY
nr:hypothetical protein [Tanacetum cinerariifolium]